jgi:hypothetical protein
MKTHNTGPGMKETAQAFSGLLQQSITAFGLLGSRSVEMLRGAVRTLAPGDDCCCEIPPPCWMPRPLGEVASHVCRGGTATLHFRVTNDSMTPRTMLIHATGDTKGVEITPLSLLIGPMQRDIATASFTVATDRPLGEERDLVLWFRGCREHFLRWTVIVGSRGADSCHEIEVNDGPDLIHHWYDHFYCNRSCLDGK